MRCVVLAGLLLAALPAQDVPAPERFAEVKAHAAGLVASGETPALSIAVLEDGKLVWAEGFGLADIAAGRKATADTIYRIASISKPLTATGLMTLVERGLIDLDKPASAYMPQEAALVAQRGLPERMTVRRLANHTSGLAEHWCFYYDGVRPLTTWEAARRYGFAAWPPGERWNYSNLAFGILGEISARVAKKPWGRFMEAAVYDPAGMTRTTDGVRSGRETDAAVQYARDDAGGWNAVGHYAFDHDGASAVSSTAKDLIRFARLHLDDGSIDGKRILEADSARAMRVLTGRRSTRSGYGIGWSLGESHGQATFGHTGGMPGVSTRLAVFGKQRHAVVVLTNSNRRGPTNDVHDRVCRVLFPEWKPPAWRDRPRAPAKHDHVPWIGKWTGRLWHDRHPVDATLTVEKKGRAFLRLGKGPSRRLEGFRATSEGVGGHASFGFSTQRGFHGRPELHLDLRKESEAGRISGVGIARASGYFALAHFIELSR